MNDTDWQGQQIASNDFDAGWTNKITAYISPSLAIY